MFDDNRRNEDTVTATAEFPALTATDRCDRCGAQALVRVELPSGTDLVFCGHHARQHETRLREIAIAYRDESDSLSV
ncbi:MULTISPECIES: DUF7455 domain-containing protein [Aeromicrobium]|uniref:DUF7455 domain-containing protein n=1 Tax=Aeromicrobium phoceense TaxID=2754045 RepID=A0A838XJ46_9ACTN|nr:MULTISPECIES: hypothetical protein [Aeromicrobium]MBA4608788.1 hypothetical protein [Aeromicrobium phoceense]